MAFRIQKDILPLTELKWSWPLLGYFQAICQLLPVHEEEWGHKQKQSPNTIALRNKPRFISGFISLPCHLPTSWNQVPNVHPKRGNKELRENKKRLTPFRQNPSSLHKSEILINQMLGRTLELFAMLWALRKQALCLTGVTPLAVSALYSPDLHYTHEPWDKVGPRPGRLSRMQRSWKPERIKS